MIKYLLIILPVVLALVFPDADRHYGKGGECLECHSGMLEKEFSHPGVETGCLICHVAADTIHPGVGTKDFTLASAVPVLCLECHTEMDESIQPLGFAHGPVKTGKSCLACHDPHASDVAKQLLMPSRELCISCHDSHASAWPAVMQGSIRFGEWQVRMNFEKTETGGSCATACHGPEQYDRENAVKN